MTGFSSSGRAVLEDLRSRVGVGTWAVARRDGTDCVLLATTAEEIADVGRTVPWADTLAAQVLDGSVPAAAADVRTVPLESRKPDQAWSGIGAYVCVPVVDQEGRTLGVLSGWSSQPSADLAAALPVASRYGRLLGTLLSSELRVLAATRRAERAEAVADVDPVTGAWSTWAWHAAVAGEDEIAAESNSAVSVVLAGLEDAEDAGATRPDRKDALRELAATLRSRLRHGDVIGRVSAEELGVLLPETPLDAARALADDLRRSLRQDGVPAVVGVATRTPGTHVSDVVRAARSALHEERRRAARAGAQAPQPLADPATPAARTGGTVDPVDALLAVARDRLGMDVTFLSRFEGADWVVRNAATAEGDPVRPGLRVPRSQTYCDRMASGALERVVPDARRHPIVGPLAVTTEMDIDTWMGVPIYRRDGRLYGTLCAFSHSGNADDAARRQHDLSLLEVLAVVVADLVEAEGRRGAPEREVLARLTAVREAGGPTIVFQPVVELASGRTVGYEALSRFPPGTPSADRWFADATAAGLGPELELAAVMNAVRRLDDVDGRLGLNVSPDVLCSPAFGRALTGVPLDRLVVELTEHQVVEDYDRVLGVLRPLRAAGLWLAVDDVGAGFSSLLHVLRMEPDVLKLDVGLVRQLDADARRRTLVQSMGRFAAENGALVVAEGIETAAELACLRDIGVTHGQGYLLGRPTDLEPRGWARVSTRRGA